MKRRDFLAICAAFGVPGAVAATGQPYDRGLLWRIDRDGSKPSHVFGTIHNADSRLAILPRPVVEVLESSRSLMLEFVPDPYTRKRFLEAGMLPSGETLEQKIGTRNFARALEYLQPIGLKREFVNRLKPWSVLLNLRDPASAGGVSVDAQLLELARARRMPYAQTESVEEQIFTFDEFPMSSQIALLKHSLEHLADLRETANRTLEAYLARDLEAIWQLREQLARRYPEIAEHLAAMNKRVLFDRSVVMAFRMQRELRKGRAFVALGALHLYGPRGVLALLEEYGCRSTRIY